jgi:hypothetical protein
VFVTPADADPVIQSDVTITAGDTRTLDVELGEAPPAPVFPPPAAAVTTEEPAPAPAPAAPAPTPAPAPAPAPAVTVPAPEPKPALTATVRRTRGARLGGALRKGVPLRLTCATACRARVVVRVGGRVAGVTTRTLRAHHRTTVRVRLRPQTRRHLRKRHRVHASVAVQLRSADGQTRTLRRTIVLRRR